MSKKSLFSRGDDLVSTLSLRILARLLGTLALFFLSGFILYFGAAAIYMALRIPDDSLISRAAHLANDNALFIGALYYFLGFCAIFFYYWRKPFRYLQTLVSAAESLYAQDDALIELPEELRELAVQMNNIKLSAQRNARAAREAEQRKNDLVVYLAHDLKTPLTSVIGYLTLLRDEKAISLELRDRYTSISLDKAERLEELINEFFDITRFNLSALTLESRLINLSRMLEQITDEFTPLLQDKNLSLTLNAPQNVVLSCDPDKLQRVFDNLIRNAINYSFENDNILIVMTEEEKEVRLSFINHGNTIPKHKLEKIFEQFYRLDSARGTHTGGAGLGLAIAKEIIELHGGTISAHSDSNVIDFEVTLPKA